MYGLKRDANLSFLIGREVIQVAIGVHHVIFHFEEDISISVGANLNTLTIRGPLSGSPGLHALQQTPWSCWVPRSRV